MKKIAREPSAAGPYAPYSDLSCARRIGTSAIATVTARRKSSASVGRYIANRARHVLTIPKTKYRWRMRPRCGEQERADRCGRMRTTAQRGVKIVLNARGRSSGFRHRSAPCRGRQQRRGSHGFALRFSAGAFAWGPPSPRSQRLADYSAAVMFREVRRNCCKRGLVVPSAAGRTKPGECRRATR